MDMMKYLEADKEQLMSALSGAASPEQAQAALEKEFDRLLLRYNEDCTEEKARDAAKYILQAAKMMIPLMSAQGESRIWSKSGAGACSDHNIKMTAPVIACMAGGILFLAGAVVGLAVSAGDGLSVTALLSSLPAVILGGGLLFLAGRLSLSGGKKGPSGEDSQQQVEIRISPEKVWSCTRALVLSIDKSLQEVREAAAYEKSRLSASVGNGISPEEAELFSAVLESAYSRREEAADDTTAQEMISMVRYYLHRKQVETVEFGGGKREWFELLPGKSDMTLRPAFVRDGVLLRKGLAVTAQ